MRTLETERLLLTQWAAENADDFHELMSQPSCIDGNWKPTAGKEESAELLKSYRETDGIFAVCLKESRKAVGFIKIYPDHNRGRFSAQMISYLMNEAYRNNGYMTEAVKRMIPYAFGDLNADLLSAFTTPQNVRLRSVLEKSGFTYEGTIQNGYRRYDGEIFDSVIYSISKSDYRKYLFVC